MAIEEGHAFTTLEPGDIIATGTPDHPGGFKPGGVVEHFIPSIDALQTPVVARV